MADNELRTNGRFVRLPVGTTESGDPVCVGSITGVAQYDDDADGMVVIDRKGSYKLPVKAIDGSGNSPVAIGDAIYYVSGNTPKLDKTATGVLFGYVLEAIDSGDTATIEVLLK